MIRRLALTVLVVAALAPTLRGDAAPPVLIQPGVTLAGVSVGGMSNEQAQAALRPAFAEPVRLVYGDSRWRLQPTRFGGQVTIADGVLQALGAQAGAAVPLVPEVDRQEVGRFVNALDKPAYGAAESDDDSAFERIIDNNLKNVWMSCMASTSTIQLLFHHRLELAIQSVDAISNMMGQSLSIGIPQSIAIACPVTL